jgi:hypothetical protein
MLQYCGQARILGLPNEPVERIAAAVAVGLYLQGIHPQPTLEEAAAIGTALRLARVRQQPRRHPERPPSSGWALSGRMHHMGVRIARQERAHLRALA